MFKERYGNALKQGKVYSAYACVMLVGPGGVGKSSFLCGLMNKPLPVGDSTQLAQCVTVRVSSQLWATAGKDPEAFWIELTDKDEVMELVGMLHLVAKDPRKKVRPITHSGGLAEDLQGVQRRVVDEVLSQAADISCYLGSVTVPRFEVLLRTWDCGGQTVFLEVLPAFLTRRTMFLLMYDSRRKLTDPCVSQSYQAGEVVSEHRHKRSTQEILLEWMACIHTVLGKSQSEEDNIPKFPRIMTVGTHGDDAQVNTDKKQIIASISSACQHKAFVPLLKKNVIVDNTTAGKGEKEDPVYKEVRREISSFAKKELSFPTPVAWVLYRRILQKAAKETNSPTISYKVALDIGQACHIPEDDIPIVLQFYHDLAIFFHYSGVPSLKDYIIANPQWLVDQFAKILAPKGFEGVQNPPLWDMLRKRGILVQPLYEEVWKESEIPSQSLMDLLVYFLLASPLRDGFKSYPGKQYFVSCVLPASSEEKSEMTKGVVLHAAPLHMRFNTQYLPPGFFSRLITTLANEQKCEVIFTDGVYCDKITMLYGDPSSMIDEVTILKCTSSIQFNVARTKCRPSQCPPFSIACSEILQLLDNCVVAVLEWLPGVEVSYAFLCDHCPKEQNPDQLHFIPVPANSTSQSVLRCEKFQFPELTRYHQFWLTILADEQLRMCETSELSEVELKQLTQILESRGKLQELAEVLEVSVHQKSLQSCPDAGYETLLAWSADMQKHGVNLRAQMIHHLKMIEVTDVATKLSLGRPLISGISRTPTPSSQMSPVKDTAKDIPSTLKLSVLLRELTPLASDWENIGIDLGIDDGTLSVIKVDEQFALGRLREMLRAWLKRADPQPSWTDMIKAVKLINESRAEELRSKYCFHQ